MKQTAIIMGMPITVDIVDGTGIANALQETFAYFRAVDEEFSPYKATSEVSALNGGRALETCSPELQHIMALCEETRQQTNGYFDVRSHGTVDPSGLVKGWAIQQAALQLKRRGFTNFSVEAGGDFQLYGHNAIGSHWRIGIRNPRNRQEIIRVVTLSGQGIATSGTAIRGQHIYNPFRPTATLTDLLSITVVGPTVYDADRFATAAFAMGREGLNFIEALPGFEAYAVTSSNRAILTSGFERYCTV